MPCLPLLLCYHYRRPHRASRTPSSLLPLQPQRGAGRIPASTRGCLPTLTTNGVLC